MEIRRFSDIMGVLTTEAIAEGRFVRLTAAPTFANDPYGYYGDLPGVALPTSSAEALQAKYVLGFAMDNRPLPIYDPNPFFYWVVRNYGFESGQRLPDADNVPMTNTTVHLTHPSVTQGLTVASGVKALAYAGGIYTFPSGEFVYTADLQTPGAAIAVQYSGTDRGKPMYNASGTIGYVHDWDADNFAVTIRTLVP